MNSRQTRLTHIPEVPVYSFIRPERESLIIQDLLSRYRTLTEDIQSHFEKASSWWDNTKTVPSELYADVKDVREQLRRYSWIWWSQRNILKDSWCKDRLIWSWKDNRVYQYSKDSYVYKESVLYGTPENILFLRWKYALLRRYLGHLIPQSRFVLGEVLKNQQVNMKIGNVPVFETKVITIQRKVKWKSLQLMTFDERKDQDLLDSLKIAHQKYVLFKMFISTALRELWLPEDTFDVKMDIWPISNIDTLDVQDPSTIKNNLTSPNIMWDGKNIHFIDFDFGVWDETKDVLFKELLTDSYLKRWHEMLKLFWIAT
jgi:hypothetical protein